MRARKNKSSASRSATPKRRSRNEVVALLGHSFRHAVLKHGRNVSETARVLRVSRSTLHRWLAGEAIDVAKVAEFTPLWEHFLRCLVVLERKARVI